jgi:hypothetical protein
MKDLSKSKVIGGHKFDLNDDAIGTYYECRGNIYHDEDHDEVPEPSLQRAAESLKVKLKEEGVKSHIEHGEKGWIEVYIID